MLVDLFGEFDGELLVFGMRQRLAAEANFFRVEHDHEVARIDVRRICGLVLAHQDRGQACRQAADDLRIGVDDEPLRRGIFLPQERRATTIGTNVHGHC